MERFFICPKASQPNIQLHGVSARPSGNVSSQICKSAKETLGNAQNYTLKVLVKSILQQM